MGTLIKKMRIRLNISQLKLAKATGLNQSTISRIEQNCISSSYKNVYKLFLYLKNKSLNNLNINDFYSDKLYEFLIFLLEEPLFINKIINNPIEAAKSIINKI